MLGTSLQRKRQGARYVAKPLQSKSQCAVQSQPDTWWISTNFGSNYDYVLLISPDYLKITFQSFYTCVFCSMGLAENKGDKE